MDPWCAAYSMIRYETNQANVEIKTSVMISIHTVDYDLIVGDVPPAPTLNRPEYINFVNS